MKQSRLRTDPEKLRAWQRRSVVTAQAKQRKRAVEEKRRRERTEARASRILVVAPEYVTPIVVRTPAEIAARRTEIVHPVEREVGVVNGSRRKFNGQTIIARESGEVVAFFRSSHAWHPPMIVARPSKGAAWARVRREVLEAAHGRCQAGATPGCRLVAQHVHHVLPRGRGGKDNGSTPLLAVCFVCHDWIHGHPAVSYEHGWLVRSGL